MFNQLVQQGKRCLSERKSIFEDGRARRENYHVCAPGGDKAPGCSRLSFEKGEAMTQGFTRRISFSTLTGFMGIGALTFFIGGTGGAASPAKDHSQQTRMTQNLPEGHRVIEGEIKFIRGRLAEVEIIQDKENHGLTMPRFVSLDRPGETGATPHPGDPIKLVVNSQNMVVDYFVPEKK